MLLGGPRRRLRRGPPSRIGGIVWISWCVRGGHCWLRCHCCGGRGGGRRRRGRVDVVDDLVHVLEHDVSVLREGPVASPREEHRRAAVLAQRRLVPLRVVTAPAHQVCGEPREIGSVDGRGRSERSLGRAELALGVVRFFDMNVGGLRTKLPPVFFGFFAPALTVMRPDFLAWRK